MARLILARKGRPVGGLRAVRGEIGVPAGRKAVCGPLSVAGETPASAAICLPVRRWRRSRSIFSMTSCGVGWRSRCGRELRSSNVARGLAHLARTGFFKPVHVKSLSAHAVRSLIIARKKLVGQRVTLENQIRGLAVVFGIRLPRALTAAFIHEALTASEGVAGLSAAMRGLIAARTAVITAVAAIDTDMRQMARTSAACSGLMTIPGVGQLTALAFVAAIFAPPISRHRRLPGLGAQAASVGRGRLRRRHLEMRRPARANPPVRGRHRHADPLQGPAQAQGLGLRHRQAINHAQGAYRSGAPPRDHHAFNVARWNRVLTRLDPAIPNRRPHPAPKSNHARGREQTTAPILSRAANHRPIAFSTEPPCTQLTPSSAERAGRERRCPKASTPGRASRP